MRSSQYNTAHKLNKVSNGKPVYSRTNNPEQLLLGFLRQEGQELLYSRAGGRTGLAGLKY